MRFLYIMGEGALLRLASTSNPLAHAGAHILPQCLTSRPKQHLPVCLHIAASAIAIVPDRCSGLVVGRLSTDVRQLSPADVCEQGCTAAD